MELMLVRGRGGGGGFDSLWLSLNSIAFQNGSLKNQNLPGEKTTQAQIFRQFLNNWNLNGKTACFWPKPWNFRQPFKVYEAVFALKKLMT